MQLFPAFIMRLSPLRDLEDLSKKDLSLPFQIPLLLLPYPYLQHPVS